MPRMSAPVARPSIRDLIRLSDMARLNPARVDELLDRCADPSIESRPEILSECTSCGRVFDAARGRTHHLNPYQTPVCRCGTSA